MEETLHQPVVKPAHVGDYVILYCRCGWFGGRQSSEEKALRHFGKHHGRQVGWVDPHLALFSYARTKITISCACGWVGGLHSEHERARRHWYRHVEQVKAG